MYYSQEVLDNFGEENIEEILLSNKSTNVFSNTYHDKRVLNAIENYMIKYYRNAKDDILRECIENRLNYLFELIEVKPYVLAYSRILSDPNVIGMVIQGSSYRFIKYRRAVDKLRHNFNENNNYNITGTIKSNFYAFLLAHIDFKIDKDDIGKCIDERIGQILLSDIIPEDNISRIFLSEYIIKYMINKYSDEDYPVKAVITNMVAKENGTFRASIIGDDTIYINPDDDGIKYKNLKEMVNVICLSSIKYINKKNGTNLEESVASECTEELYNNARKQREERSIL